MEIGQRMQMCESEGECDYRTKERENRITMFIFVVRPIWSVSTVILHGCLPIVCSQTKLLWKFLLTFNLYTYSDRQGLMKFTNCLVFLVWNSTLFYFPFLLRGSHTHLLIHTFAFFDQSPCFVFALYLLESPHSNSNWIHHFFSDSYVLLMCIRSVLSDCVLVLDRYWSYMRSVYVVCRFLYWTICPLFVFDIQHIQSRFKIVRSIPGRVWLRVM